VRQIIQCPSPDKDSVKHTKAEAQTETKIESVFHCEAHFLILLSDTALCVSGDDGGRNVKSASGPHTWDTSNAVEIRECQVVDV